MPRITKKAITFNDLDLHILSTATSVPYDDDGAGYGQTRTNAPTETVTQVANLANCGDLADAWNTATFHDHGSRREEFIKTVRSIQELEITLPWRPSEAAQAALLAAFNSSSDRLTLALIAEDGVDADQLTFTCEIVSHNNMFSDKTARSVCSFTVNLVGEVAYGARVTA